MLFKSPGELVIVALCFPLFASWAVWQEEGYFTWQGMLGIFFLYIGAVGVLLPLIGLFAIGSPFFVWYGVRQGFRPMTWVEWIWFPPVCVFFYLVVVGVLSSWFNLDIIRH